MREGAMAASSSSREDDRLSQSSGETERVAMQTLRNMDSANSASGGTKKNTELTMSKRRKKTNADDQANNSVNHMTKKPHDFYDRPRKDGEEKA